MVPFLENVGNRVGDDVDGFVDRSSDNQTHLVLIPGLDSKGSAVLLDGLLHRCFDCGSGDCACGVHGVFP